jgi:hypothetical protein
MLAGRAIAQTLAPPVAAVRSSWFRPLRQSGQIAQHGAGRGHALDLPGVGEGPCDENLRGDTPMAEHLR